MKSHSILLIFLNELSFDKNFHDKRALGSIAYQWSALFVSV